MINIIPGSWRVVLVIALLLFCILCSWWIRPRRRGASYKYARRAHPSFFNDAKRQPGKEPW